MTRRGEVVQLTRLEWAKPCLRPEGMPVGRPQGVKAVGLRYEARVAEAVYRATNGASVAGQWWEYYDVRLGLRHCQTDVIVSSQYDIEGDRQLRFVLEVKLTEVEEARAKLMGLYIPVMTAATRDLVRGIIVTRHLTKETQKKLVCDSLGEAMRLAASGVIPTLHWLAKGPSI